MPLLGTMIYAQNRKSHIHRLAFFLTLLISYWAFTEYNIIQADSYAEAFFWTKAGCFKIILSPFLIHFILVYISRWNTYNKFKAFSLLYLPAFALACADLFSGAISGSPVKENWGWASGRPAYPSIVIIYFVWKISALSFAGKEALVFLKNAAPNQRNSFTLFLYGIIAAVVLGIASTYVSGMMPNFPDISIIIAEFFSIYLSYIIWKYNFFPGPSDTAEDIINLMGDSLILAGPHNRILRVNQTLLKLSGYTENELLNADVSILFDRFLESPVNLEKEEKITSVETRLISKTGQSIPVLLSKTVVYNKCKMAVITIIIAKDLSLWYKAQKEFIHAEKLESYEIIVRGIVHDFNNLLSSISGHLEITEISGKLPESLKRNVALCRKAISVAINLTRQLSMYAKENELDISVCHISEIIQESAELALKGTFIQFDIQSDDNLRLVKIDRFKFIQVFMNLFINARQAMPNDGKINVTCSNYSDSLSKNLVKLLIQDDGEGIPDEIIDKIFNPFFTTKQKGTGLGLHIVKSIVEAHQGSISVESKLHAGTTFTILLPGVTEFENHGKADADITNTISEKKILSTYNNNESIRVGFSTVLTQISHNAEQIQNSPQVIESTIRSEAN
jgi:PAS domain S-box-containing protein